MLDFRIIYHKGKEIFTFYLADFCQFALWFLIFKGHIVYGLDCSVDCGLSILVRKKERGLGGITVLII